MNRSSRRGAPEWSGFASRLALLGALIVALVVAVPADAQITRGSIAGTIRDATGAVVPGATVTVTNMGTNISRTTASDAQGFYRVGALDPGSYSVRAELTGFSTVEYKEIQVRTATEVPLGVDMKVAPVESETITVLGKAEAVELNKSNPTIGLTTTARQVVELPLGADRNINALVLLTPNAVSTTGQGNYAVNGQRSRNNNFMIDGSDNNDISVTIATSPVVPESVAEYQVLTNPYQVEFGRNSGAQINVITKSGTNRFRGEAWDYYRTAGLFSLTNIEKDAGRLEPARSIRHQLGADIGGPLIKDKTFFFALYQHDTQRSGATPGATVRIPTPTGFATMQGLPLGAGQTAASRQAVLQRIGFLQDVYSQNVAFRNVTTTLVNGVPVQTGQTNVNIVQPSTYKTFLGRLDHRLGSNDNVTLRYTYADRQDIDQVSNCAFGVLFCGSQALKDTNLAASETHIFSPALLNEFRFSWVKRDLDFPENDPASPTATITGLFTIGGAANFPQSRITDSYQFSDMATWMKGRHTFKIGADVRYNKVINNAAFDSKGTFTFNNLQDYMNNTASVFAQALQTASWDSTQWQTGVFLSDDFRMTADLVVNLGLRYERSEVPLGFFGATDAQSLSALVPGPVKPDTNNWGPRVGFAWSPRSSGGFLGDGKTVFRGGFGVGYDVLFYNLLTVNASNFPRVVVPRLTNVQNVYPNLLPVTGAANFDPLATWVNSDENTQNPEARFYSFSVQREIGDFVAEVGYAGSRSYHGINQQEANPAVLTPAQIATVQASRNPNSIPQTQARRLSPQFGSRVRIPSDVGPGGVDAEARSEYQALIVSLNKRMSHGIQFGASYTHSKWMSNNDASLGEGGTDGSSQRAQNLFDIEAEWSRSQFDRPHRFVINYLVELPGPDSGFLKHVVNGWQLSGVTQVQSGRPFTIFTGVDSSGDGNTGSDRPNINPNGTFVWDDEHKTFTNNGFYTAPVGNNNLPLQNGLGNGNAPRNSERGEGFWQTDVSLSKKFSVGRSQLVFRADLLNALNQDSYGNPISNMTNAGFGTNTNNFGRRTVTFGLKYIY